MTKTVLIISPNTPTVKMFEAVGWNVTLNPENDQLQPYTEPDLLCFTGGSDVSPYLYGEENISSHCDPVRDEYEKQVYESFVGVAPMVGICRGGQFLNVMNGGSMKQHIDGHNGDNQIKHFKGIGSVLKVVREDHHQGIVPHIKMDRYSEVLAVDPRDDNVEIVWYGDTKCLCFQPHPEWGHWPTRQLFFQLIEEYIG